MTKVLSTIIILFLLFASSAFAAPSVNTRVKSVDVAGLDLIIYKQETEYFFFQCSSREAWRTSGYRTLSIGDVVDFAKKTIQIGFIERIEYTTDTTANYAGVKLKRNKGDTDCIIVNNEFQYPVDGKCENVWILVEGCRSTEE